MRRILLALLLAVCGGLLLHEGWVAAHSLGGTLDYYSKGIVYKVAGQIRLPGFALMFGGGALLVGAAWWMLAAGGGRGRRRRR